MAAIVGFDQKGVFGPAMTLIYNAQSYKKLGLARVADLLEANFINLAKRAPEGKIEFLEIVNKYNKAHITITAAEIVSTRFFQSMQTIEHVSSHKKVLEEVVPQMIRNFDTYIPEANGKSEEALMVREWAAGLLECYLTEQQIEGFYSPENSLEARKKLGIEITQAATSRQITAQDLDRIVEASSAALEHLKNADNVRKALHFTGGYVNLFSLGEKPFELGKNVLTGLSVSFKAKMFPKEESGKTENL